MRGGTHDRHSTFSHGRPARRFDRGVSRGWRLVLILALMILAPLPALADEVGNPDAGTPSAPIETTLPEPTPTEANPPIAEPPPVEETEVPTEPTTEVPTPEETPSQDEAALGDADSEDQPGTPVPDAEDENVASENVIPFAPELECEPRVEDEAAVAGERDWTLLKCSVTWETRDIESLAFSVQPRDSGWTVRVLEAELPGEDESALIERIEVSEKRLTLHAPDDAETFTSADLLIGVRFGCLAPVRTTLDVDLVANASDESTPRVHEATEEIHIGGQAPVAPRLHDVALTFAPIENLLESRISAGSLVVPFAAAPATCGWSISFHFADFVAGEQQLAAENLVAIAVAGLDGVTVTSDGGVITLLIPESPEPRPDTGTFEVSLELNVGSFLPRGTYRTAVTVEVAVMPQGE